MLIFALLAAAASPTDGGTMMADDWHTLVIYGVGGESNGPFYLQVHAGDLDGDGRADDAIVKLQCADGKVQQAMLMRESGIGSPTERRQYAPVKFVKEWSAASPQLTAMKPTYDVKNLKGNEKRTSRAGPACRSPRLTAFARRRPRRSSSRSRTSPTTDRVGQGSSRPVVPITALK